MAGRVVVVGSIGGDIVVATDRHPRAGETVPGAGLAMFPGGKGANQALAAARAGAATAMVGRIGDDEAGRRQQAMLAGSGVDISGVRVCQEAPTQTAIIVVDSSGENTIVVCAGASGLVDASDSGDLHLDAADVLVCQLEIPQPAVLAALRRAHRAGALTILNLAPAAEPIPGLLDLVDMLVVNETEAAFLLGRSTVITPGTAASVARELRTRDDQTFVVTLSAAGAVAVRGEDVIAVGGHEVDVLDTTGAGDCFVGYLAAERALGGDLDSGLVTANAAASICVQRRGAGSSQPTRDEVLAGSR
ncbi:MAG: ribokinase [Candidatus Dormibacteria bacterium]